MIKSISNTLMSNKIGLISVVAVEIALIVASYLLAGGIVSLV